jgi:integrase
MATIQKLSNNSGVSYRVLIRKKGLKAISKTFSTKRLASQFALKIESDTKAQQAFGGISNTTTFIFASKDYLLNRYPGIRPPRSHEGRIEYWDKWFKDKRLIDITKSDITSGLKELPDRLSNTTINKYKAAASVVFSYACREYDLPDNPVRHIRSLPEPRGRIRFLSDDERSRLFEACRASNWDKLYPLVLLAITTGARKGELLGLRWCDVDFDRQTAFISTTKNGEPRVLPLTDSVVVELSRFKDQEPELIFNSEIATDKPFCFYKQWKKALFSADIENFRYHDIRHTTASYLAQSGASLLEIADVLGHKQIQMAARYSHLTINHKQRLINKVLGGITNN